MQNDTLVSTSPLQYERIVDAQRNVQKARLTKLCYQQTDVQGNKKNKTNTMNKITDKGIFFFLTKIVQTN